MLVRVCVIKLALISLKKNYRILLGKFELIYTWIVKVQSLVVTGHATCPLHRLLGLPFFVCRII